MSLTVTPLAAWKASSRRPFAFLKALATVSVTVADRDRLLGLVELDPQAERLEGLALDLGCRATQLTGQVGEPGQLGFKVVEVGFDLRGAKSGKVGLGGRDVGAQLSDAGGDDLSLDSIFEGLNLDLDAAFGVGDEVAQPCRDVAELLLVVAGGGLELPAKSSPIRGRDEWDARDARWSTERAL